MDTIDKYKQELAEEPKSKRERSALNTKLAEEAQAAHQCGNYDISLDRFAHLVALSETDPKAKCAPAGAHPPRSALTAGPRRPRRLPSELHATFTANLGASLHHLGRMDEAKELYEKAIEEFGQLPTGWLTWFVYGDLTAKRLEHVRMRQAVLEKGERPDPSSYQDGGGKERKWRPDEMDGSKPTHARRGLERARPRPQKLARARRVLPGQLTAWRPDLPVASPLAQVGVDEPAVVVRLRTVRAHGGAHLRADKDRPVSFASAEISRA